MRIFTQLWKKQYLLLVFVLLCSVMPAIADDNNLITQQITVNLKKPGTLSSLIGDDDKYRIVNLKITGYMNCDDFVFIRDIAGLASIGTPHKRDSEIIGYDYKTEETPGKLQYLDIQNTTWRASAYSSFIIDGCYCTDDNPSFRTKAMPAMGDYVFKSLSNLRKIVLPNWMPIGNGLFTGCNSLTSANIPEGVTSIGEKAFWGCNSLTSVNIPEGVTSIGDEAFKYCRSLTSVNIPEGVTSIGWSAFGSCSSLTSVNIPGSLKQLNYIFGDCTSLTTVYISKGVTSIGENAFSGCNSLTSVNIPEGVTSIGNDAFWGCSSLTSVNIPEGVTSIGWAAFWNCSSLTSVYIPEGVTSIGSSAFSGCALSYIRIPNSVASIESETFAGCKNLRSLNIPSSITRIEADFCKGSAIKYLYFDNPSTPPSLEGDVTLKDYFRFIAIVPDGSHDTYDNSDWGLFNIRERGDIITETKKIHIDQAGTLRDILDRDTARKLTEVVITGELNLNDFLYLRQAAGCFVISGEDVVRVDGVLQNIDLSNAKLIDDGNFSYDFIGFYRDKDQIHIYTLDEEASIGDNGKSFQGLFACLYGLATVRLPRNLTTIGRYAFYDDSNLFTVEIPESVTEIDSYAFACPNLINIYCHGATPANIADETVFSEIDKDQCTLYVPEGSVEAYRTAKYWKDFKNIKEKYYSSTGINKVNTYSGSQKEVHEISRYSINGQRLNAPTRGINIVKYSDGTTKKIMVP